LLFLLLLLSAGSGVAALIYEIVWFQFLELVIGSTAVALGLLLAVFMGGLCLGSLLLPRLVPQGGYPLRIYAAIEAAIGVFGLLVWLVMPLVSGPAGALCLLPPTFLMGMTFPALARAAEEIPRLGAIYAANIGGAVFGSLVAGFYLLRVYDVGVATYVAVAVNAAVAAVALIFPTARGAGASAPGPEFRTAPPVAVYLALGLSGFCALACEAIWTRLLGLLFGASVYTLSLILAVFLTGLGIGSGLGSLLLRVVASPRMALAWCQWLAAAAIAWFAYNISAWFPYWPVDPSIATNIWFNFQVDLVRAFWAVLPATVLWGASFPLALAGAKQTDPARLASRVYAANTLGAIAGALTASLILIAWIGSQRAQQLLIALSVAAGLVVLPARQAARAAVAIAVGMGLILSVPPFSKLLVAYGRYAATWAGKSEIVYAREGLNSSVAVASFPGGALTFHVAGKIQASNVPRDMRLQRMLGHLTSLTDPHPRSVLVIGCGAGITAGAVSVDPLVERETIVEIEPLVPQAAGRYFTGPNFDVLHNPKVQMRIADGRHFLLTTSERFDGITVDPLDPWVKGAANLYTEEFLEAMKRHLNPGGVVTMYIQLFETDLAAVKSSVATFFDVFPNGTIWGNPYEGKGHDMVLLGTVEPLRVDLGEVERRWHGGKLAESLAEVGMKTASDLFANYAGRKSELGPWLRGAPLNRDRNLRMEYLAGFGLNKDDAAAIYAGMLAYRREPVDLFSGR